MWVLTVFRVDADLSGDGADRQALAMQIQDHDELPKFDHRVLPPARRRSLGDSARPPAVPGMPGTPGSHENWGNFKCHKWGELLRHSHGRHALPLKMQLGPSVAPPEAVVLHQMLMEMLDREALVALAIEPLHFLRPVRRDPLARRLAEPAVDKSG